MTTDTVRRRCKVLIVGSGGIGCELLKTLSLSGANQLEQIALVDLDTIDLSNLNRQFLFRRQHIGQSKCKVAAEAIMKQLEPPFTITPYHANIITDPRFTLDWFKSFDFVMNALDNLEARRHVNKMCLAAGKPLIESGTAGLLGQASLHMKGETECFDCTSKAKPTAYPVCTIRSTPSKPIHCVVWAKSWLFPQLFGKPEDEEVANGEDENVNLTELENLRKESLELQKLRSLAGDSNEYADQIIEKIFVRDIQRLLLDEETWKQRPENRPTPLDITEMRKQLEQQSPVEQLEGIARDHTVWSLRMSFKVFHDSCRALGKRLVADGGGEFEFEKDDEDMMDLIAAATNLRSFIFGILPIQTRFQTKEMAGNIIPAIATTNAVISGFMSLIANRLIANLLSYPPAKLSEGVRSAYLINGNPNRQILSEALQPPNAQCSVCSQLEYRQVEVNCDSVTLGTLLQFVARDGLEMGGDVQIIRSSDGALLYDFDFEDNLDITLTDLKLTDGKRIILTDEDDPKGNDKIAVELFIKHNSEMEKDKYLLVDNSGPLRMKPKRAEKRKADDDEAQPAKQQRMELFGHPIQVEMPVSQKSKSLIALTKMMRSFRNLGLHDRLLINLARQKIFLPTEIQYNSIKTLNNDCGKNYILLSETGSGKTLSYLLPAINRTMHQIDPIESRPSNESSSKQQQQQTGTGGNLLRGRSPEALILLPNSDLVSQADEVVSRLAADSMLRWHCLYHDGGHNGLQSMRLPPGTDLLLTTFPALSQIQHLIGDLFSRTRYVVVDEADLLLSGEGSPVARYRPRQLLEQLQQATASPSDLANPQRQFVFVGATMPAGRHTAREYINSRFSPVKMLYSSGSHQPVRTLTQQWITFPSSNKAESLVMDQDVNNGDSLHEEKCQELFNLLREDRQHSKILVFTNTTESTEQTYASLRSLLDQNPNLAASTRLLRLHSALARTERQLAVSQFTASSSNNADELSASETTFDKSTTIMIAGDVVARGFDFADVDRVVQFDFSLNMVQYLHRIGRTARGGRQGEVVNFIGPQDVRLSNHIQHALANNQPLDATYDEQEGDGTGLINEKSPVDQTAFARLFSRNRSLRKRDRRKLSHQQQISASA